MRQALGLPTSRFLARDGTSPSRRLYAQVDFRREMRPIAFVDPGAFVGTNPKRSKLCTACEEFQEFSAAFEHEWMVVDRENSNSRGVGAHDRSPTSSLCLRGKCLRQPRRPTSGRVGGAGGDTHFHSVPAFTSLHTVNLPPIMEARSRMPGNP